MSFWVIAQLLTGVALVVVPVALAGSASLRVTVPIYAALVVITLTRERLQRKRQVMAGLLQKLSALVSDFSILTQGAHGNSVWGILRDLGGNAQFRAQMDISGNHQAGELLDDRCQRLFSDAGDLVWRIDHMNWGTSDTELRDIVRDFGLLIVEYRTLVSHFLKFLEHAKGEKESIQQKTPFSVRVHRYLADEYDRLMDDIRRIREELRPYAGHDWLPDEHLTRFPRAPLFS